MTEEISNFVDDIETDNIGYLIGIKRGTEKNAKKVMVAAHMDEIGFITTYIDDNGFLKFHIFFQIITVS